MTMRLGIYGGTFNPIHIGHTNILYEFARRLKLDKVLIIPTATPPHKNAAKLANAQDRLNMCELAVGKIEGVEIEISDIEITRKGKSFTSDTLRQLKKIYPDAELFLLMGEDMFLSLDTWHEPEVITKLATLCACARSVGGLEKLTSFGEALAEKFGATSIIEDIPYIDVSSTVIREKISKGESISGLVAPEVEAYIIKHQLYA